MRAPAIDPAWELVHEVPSPFGPLRATRPADRLGWVVFSGGRWGKHALYLPTRTDDEVWAHWVGYCENNGADPRATRRVQ